MYRTVRSLARVLSGPLAALMLVMSVAAPAYERADLGHELAIESEHDPATCPPAHDHAICVLASALQGVAAPTHEAPAVVTARSRVLPPAAPETARSGVGVLPHPRGPPSA